MKLASTITDNVTELLLKIIDFTERRRLVIRNNITNVNTPGYIPQDLDVECFAELMTRAVAEHVRSERLVLCDSENIKFGAEGAFESLPVADEQSDKFLEEDPQGYLEQQVDRLAETLLNNKVARQLLRQKQGLASRTFSF